MKSVPLGELCDVVAGGTPSRSQAEYFGGDVAWVKISDMLQGRITSTDESLSREGLVSCRAKVLPVGTLLVSIFATIGRTAVLGIPAATNQAIVGVTPRRYQDLDADYLRHYLDFTAIRLNQQARGVAQNNINASMLKAVSIPLPPLAEQKRIAALLDKADDLRGKRRQALARADLLITSVFHDYFGEPVKLPLTWKEHAKTSPGWSECTVGDQLLLQRGKDITKNIARAGNIPVISSGGVSFFHDEAFARGPGVLLGRKGSVGNVHYVESDYWPHDTTLYVRDFKGNERLFVYHFFLRFPILHYEASAANPSLNRNNLHPVKVHWPSRELQRRFAGFVEGVERQKARMTKQLAELDTLFHALQSAAFAGTLFAGNGVSAAATAIPYDVAR